MDSKKLVLLVGALFVAAVTAMMARHMSSTPVAPQVVAAVPVPTGPQILVATRPLPVGTILGPDSFRFQPWPKGLIDNAYYVQGAAGVEPGKMAGWVVRNAISAGQPLTQGSLVSPGDRGFLAAALTPGMRAVALSVSGATAVAGFVFPGDRVDLVLTEEVPGTDGGQSLKTAETFLRNVRVLATDQRTDNTPTPEGKTAVSAFTMVTVETTPKLAERIAVAQKLGTLSLSLRPLADTSQALEKAIAQGDAASGADGRPANRMVLDLANRPQDGGPSFTTGGEVSRFARNSIPRAQAPGAGGAPGAPVVRGPMIRVARGNMVTATPIGGAAGLPAAAANITATSLPNAGGAIATTMSAGGL